MHFPIIKGLMSKAVGYIKAIDGVSFQLRKVRPSDLWENLAVENHNWQMHTTKNPTTMIR